MTMTSSQSDNSPSFVRGGTEVPLLEESLGAFLDRVADAFGDADALVCPVQGVRWSYRALRDEVDRMASGLLACGLVRGDRIGIWSANQAE